METSIDGYYNDNWEEKYQNKKGTKKREPYLNGVCLIKDED